MRSLRVEHIGNIWVSTANVNSALNIACGEHELMAMFGWEDADMARVYTRKATQKKLAVSGAAKVAHRVTIVPPTVPPAGIVSKNNALEAGWWTRQGLNL